MDNFIKYFKDITAIAERFSRIWSNKFVVDELINAAWIGYDVATVNKSLLAHKSFKKGYFLRKIKCLMKDYIRQETKIALQERLIEKGLTVPTFVSCDGRHIRSSLDFCDDVDKRDFFDELFNQVSLGDTDWKIIQSYFYDEKLLTEIGTVLDLTEAGVHIRKSKALEKLKKVAERILSS